MADAIKEPNYGLKVKLNHVYPEKRTQDFKPSLRIIWTLLPCIIRYIIYYIKAKISGKSIVMDYLNVVEPKQIYGVPIGGIGAGSIGRGYRGEFCRFQLRPGLYEWTTVEANQFIVTIKGAHDETMFHSLLSTFPKKSLKSWESFIDGSKCTYTGLYPRSWTEYDLSEFGIKLRCRQVSPIIPNNYVDSSLPCAVFVWDIENISKENRTVTIAFTFKNGTGNKKQDRASTCSAKSYSFMYSDGVVLYHTIEKMQCSYTLSVKTDEDISVSRCLYFDPNSSGIEPWLQLKNHGCFDKSMEKNTGLIHGEMACGVAAKMTLLPSKSKTTEMSLVWDMPVVNFPGKQKKYSRMYTTHFQTGAGALAIAEYAFTNYSNWEQQIYQWQSVVLDNPNLPPWYKSTLFNQLYYISDGGTIWVKLDDSEQKNLSPTDVRQTYGRFAYLEGHEYRMYNTYDVHFYASYALQMNWPQLQLSLQYDMRDAIFQEIPTKVEMLYDGHWVERKVPNTVPHDVGDPGEEPFILSNSYPVHDVSIWKDLDSKFVLQVYRDYVFISDAQEAQTYLNDMYNACYVVLKELLKFDVDNDGLIENSSIPDQTYDSWIMEGSSAYCGGLWLAALVVMIKMADTLGKQNDKKEFQQLLDKGKVAFEKKLWNGLYYNFDCSKDEFKSIMADQLCGQWYLSHCGFQYEIFPQGHIKSALETIFKKNVQSFCNGNLGAVNGFIDRDQDNFTVQSQEVWTGVTYALAATMIQEGMIDEAFKTAGGMSEAIQDQLGLCFDVPEALYAHKYVRAMGYMRPLSIWAMQLALDQASKPN